MQLLIQILIHLCSPTVQNHYYFAVEIIFLFFLKNVFSYFEQGFIS